MVSPAPAQPATPDQQVPPAPAAPAPAPVAPPATPSLTFAPATAQVTVNSPVNLTLQLDNVKGLFAAPLRLRFDPQILRLEKVQAGTLLTGDGQRVSFSSETMNDTGEVVVTLSRMPGSGGVTGAGALLQITFQAVAPGLATVSVVDPQFTNTQLQPVTVTAPSINVVVQ
jgi:general secretion pathway protein D